MKILAYKICIINLKIDPCSRNPCGQGICEVVPSLAHGYLCRCSGDTISLTSCNGR